MSERTSFQTTLIAIVALAVSSSLMAAEPKESKEPKERKQVIVRDGHVFMSEGGEPFFLQKGSLLPRTYVGVNLLTLSPELKTHFGAKDAGTMISTVAADSPAAKAGLKVGDVITSVNGQKVAAPGDVTRSIREKKAGESVRVNFLRGGVSQHAFITVAEREMADIDLGSLINPEMLKATEFAVESAEKIGDYFRSPEWKARIEQFQDCGRVQGQVRELEARLKELEKRLEK